MLVSCGGTYSLTRSRRYGSSLLGAERRALRRCRWSISIPILKAANREGDLSVSVCVCVCVDIHPPTIDSIDTLQQNRISQVAQILKE
jgi:hypothetical protein